jgi:hypothetical protein
VWLWVAWLRWVLVWLCFGFCGGCWWSGGGLVVGVVWVVVVVVCGWVLLLCCVVVVFRFGVVFVGVGGFVGLWWWWWSVVVGVWCVGWLVSGQH